MFRRYSSSAKSIVRNLPSSLSLKPYSDILFISEGANWVTSWEIRELARILDKLGIHSRYSGPIPMGFPRQSIFFANRYNVMLYPRRYLFGSNRVAFPYYHGHPDSGEPLFIKCYNNLKLFHNRIYRIQVSHSRMYDLTMSTGIDQAKVFLIPIGINTTFFPKQTPESRRIMRGKHEIPQNASVIGSFQKDGHGWGEGDTPKLEKGPDIFLNAVRILKESISDLFILLSGPARGYVKNGLEHLKIPYKHIYIENYPQVSELYQCLDLYIIASREEGGPKAVLECMSSGIPLVTTRVGQAMDLVRHGVNGWMVEMEDAEGLAYWAESSLSDSSNLEKIIGSGIETARSNSYLAQIGLWKKFFCDFVEAG